MLRREGGESAQRLLSLALRRDWAAAAALVGGHHDMDEPLEEIPLVLVARAPGELERLVGLEELA